MRLGKKGEFVGFTLLALLVIGLFFVSFGDLEISGYAVYSGDGDCGSEVTESSTLEGNLNCGGIGLEIHANGIELDCQGWNITYGINGSDEVYGIYNPNYDDVIIKNCNLYDGNSTNGTYQFGIYFSGSSNSGNITNNTVKTVGGNYSHGIRIDNSENNIISGNSFTTTGEYSHGISFKGDLTVSQDVFSNTINCTNDSSNAFNLDLGAHDNSFRNNVIVDSYNGIKLFVNTGLYSENNTFRNNSFSNSENYDLIILSGVNGTTLRDQNILSYNISNAIVNFMNDNGVIEYSEGINQSGDNLSADVEISNNLIYVNSSKSGLNKSAKLTFYEVTGISNAVAYRNGVKCNEDICTGFTDLGGNDYSFNVSGWSNYSVGEEDLGCEKYVNDNIMLTGDLSCNGDGLIVNSSNIEIDCNGSTIQFGNGGSGYSGIESVGFNNITIRNCNITQTGDWDEKDGIYFRNGENGTIENVSIEINSGDSFGIFLRDYNYLNILNNTINANSGGNSRAIVLFNSDNNNLTNNTMAIAAYKKGIDMAYSSDENIFLQNTISGAGGGISLLSGIERIPLESSLPCFNNTLNDNSISVSGLNLNITTGNNETWLIDQVISNYSITDSLIIINNSHGTIEYLETITENGGNLSDDIQISENFIYVNSSKSGLNKSATLSFYGYACSLYCDSFIPYKNGENCGDDCSEFSHPNSNEYKFNVVGFTNYSLGELDLQCDVPITTPNLNIVVGLNLDCNGNAIDIGANGIVLDCEGHRISYGLNGSNNSYGIENNGYSNLTIKNCNIVEMNVSGVESHGIYSYNTSAFSGSGFLDNEITTISNGSHGIYLVYHNDVNINNNTISVSGTNSTELVLVNVSGNWLDEQIIGSYNITNSKFGFNESNGSLDYLEFINDVGDNLSAKVIIGTNSIQVNTSNDNLNQNALLTFRGVTNVSSSSKIPMAFLSGSSCGDYCSDFGGESSEEMYWFRRIGNGILSGFINYSVGYRLLTASSSPGGSNNDDPIEEIEVIPQVVYNITDEEIPTFGNSYPIGFVANIYPTIGGSSNEPANCKFDFKDTSYYLMNYTLSGPAISDVSPSSFNTMHSYTFVKPLDFGNQTIYVRCIDVYGNVALASYGFSFEIINITEMIEEERELAKEEGNLVGQAYLEFMELLNDIWTWLIYIGMMVLFVGFYVLSHHTSKKILRHLEDPVKEIVKNMDLSVKKIYFFLMVREIKKAKAEYAKLKKWYFKIPANFVKEKKYLHSYIISVYNKINDVAEKKMKK